MLINIPHELMPPDDKCSVQDMLQRENTVCVKRGNVTDLFEQSQGEFKACESPLRPPREGSFPLTDRDKKSFAEANHPQLQKAHL
jgi:hypothetical protein